MNSKTDWISLSLENIETRLFKHFSELIYKMNWTVHKRAA